MTTRIATRRRRRMQYLKLFSYRIGYAYVSKSFGALLVAVQKKIGDAISANHWPFQKMCHVFYEILGCVLIVTYRILLGTSMKYIIKKHTTVVYYLSTIVFEL